MSSGSGTQTGTQTHGDLDAHNMVVLSQYNQQTNMVTWMLTIWWSCHNITKIRTRYEIHVML